MNNLILYILIIFFVFIIINFFKHREYFFQINKYNNNNLDNQLFTDTNSDQYYLNYSNNNNFINSLNSNIDNDYSNINSDDNIYPYYNNYLDEYDKIKKKNIFSFNYDNIYYNSQTDNLNNYFLNNSNINKKYSNLRQITTDAYIYSPSSYQKIICSDYKNQAECWANNKCQWSKPPNNYCEVATYMLL